jgi:leader peptidase (prepilin peptidase)/N-methyltransferase
VIPNRILILGMIRILGTIFAGLLGLAFGSFLNVCLSRWPEEESIVLPRSHCRNCTHTLAWWENVPLLSWLILRGRCRNCRTRIGGRYPLVELAVGVLWSVQAWRFPGSAFDPNLPVAVIYGSLAVAIGQALFWWLLVALAFLDAENLWLPDWLTWPGIALGFGVTLLRGVLDSRSPMKLPLEPMKYMVAKSAIGSLLAIFAAAGLILLIRWIYWLVRRREGIGLGDAKLMALLAAWLGLPSAVLAFDLGVLLGALAAVVLLAVPSARREPGNWALSKLPLGTFLCAGGVVSGLWGEPIIAAYLRWAGF